MDSEAGGARAVPGRAGAAEPSVDVPEPLYFFCNSCGEEVEETDECCDDGEIEPAYDEPYDASERRAQP